MKAFRGFILGFSISLVSVSLTGQLLSSSTLRDTQYTPNSDIKINLFKKDITPISPSLSVFTNIQKRSLLSSEAKTASLTDTRYAEIKLTDISKNSVSTPITTSNSDIVYAPENIEGTEDDEILNVNIDNQIPIDFSENTLTSDAIISQDGTDNNKIALLPSQISPNPENNVFDSPWVVAKGSKHIKNKKLLESYANQYPQQILSDTPQQLANGEEDLSYKVAERIKQSIIFPIPDEILNDENLTPTFITQQKKVKNKVTPSKILDSNSSPEQSEKEIQTPKIISKIEPNKTLSNQSNSEDKSLLSNISSWFSSKDATTNKVSSSRKKSTPSYSSQGEHMGTDNNSSLSSNDALVSFYETIQETQKEQAKNKIIPSELKLYFQPERAEISGQTLRWLKAFSEKAKENHTYLQIRLDATAPIDLQRKRLNLLYTVFMNNGVDFKKVDTVFSLTEPNTFIIRTIKVHEQNFQQK